jgi:hypothetical protein
MRSNSRTILIWVDKVDGLTMHPFNSHEEADDFISRKENGVDGKFYIINNPEEVIEVA